MLDIGSWFDSVFDMTAIYVVCFCKLKIMIVMSYKLSTYFLLYLVALLLGEFVLFNLISSDRNQENSKQTTTNNKQKRGQD